MPPGTPVTHGRPPVIGGEMTERILLFAFSLDGVRLALPLHAVGVAFAIAPDRPRTAYALDVTELQEALAAPRGVVDTGSCL